MFTEFYEEMDEFNETAKAKAGGDERVYLSFLIRFWSYVSGSDEDTQAVCMDSLKKGIKERDFALMQAAMNLSNKINLLWNEANGCDHSYMAYHIVSYLSSAGYENLYRAFPEGLPLAENGHPMNIRAANILLCLLYKDAYDREKIEADAEKYISSKQPRWDRAFAACLLGILKQDAELISEHLQILCELLARNDISDFEKLQCQFAYGILVIAYKNLPAEIYERIRLPEYKNFDPEYLQWLLKGEFGEARLIEYREPYEVFNTVLAAPLSVTAVNQPYLNEKVSAREKKRFFMDCDGMNEELVGWVLETSGKGAANDD